MSESVRDSSPARAREAGTVTRSLADFDLKISEKWIAEAAADRERQGLAVVDLRREAGALESLWRERGAPGNPHAAWLRWAGNALPALRSAQGWRMPKVSSYVPDVPDGPPPPMNWRELEAAGIDWQSQGAAA